MISFFFILFSMMQGGAAEAKELPELDAFLQEVRANLRSDRLLQSRYTYNLKQTKIRLDGDGNPKKVEVDRFEVYPSLDEKYDYMKQTVKNGKPVEPEEIKKQDRKRAKQLEERARDLEKEGLDEKTRRLQKEEEEKQKEDLIIDELFSMYDFSMVGREVLEGYPAIILEFSPRPGFKPSGREAKIMYKLQGRAWICEEDHQLMRADVEFIEDISFGKGLLAKLRKGMTASILRRRINDEVWLPARAEIKGSARILLLRNIVFNTINEYSDYKKYVVDTKIDYPAGEYKTEKTGT